MSGSNEDRAISIRQPWAYAILHLGKDVENRPMRTHCRGRILIQADSLSGHFRFVGWVEHDLVPDYINLADMVVMPSESEAFALVYLETQACERVLIASDIVAARQVIDDGESGILFHKGDVADLTAKILSVAGNQALRTAIGKTARQSAMNYDLDRFVTAYETVIRELAD